MKNISFIALGGAVGSLFRYALNHLALLWTFPIWTMIVNLIGSFLLGLLTEYMLVGKLPEHWKNGLGVGFCGGFTTMSTFAFDATYLMQTYSLVYAGIYVSSSLICGLILAMLGMYLGNRLVLHGKGGVRT